jgi:hypothetical protein
MIEQLTDPLFIMAFGVAPLSAVGWGLLLVWLHKRSIRKGTIDR